MASSLTLESSITQVVVRPPRPRNSFLLYRSVKLQELQDLREAAGRPALMMGEASKIIGKLWKQEPIEVTQYFEQQAEEEKAAHAAKYPGYKYHPRTKAEKAKEREAACAARSSRRRKQRAGLKRVKRQDSVSSASTDSEISSPHIPVPFVPMPESDLVPHIPQDAIQGYFIASAQVPPSVYHPAPPYFGASSGFPVSWWGASPGFVPQIPPFMQVAAQTEGVGAHFFYPLVSVFSASLTNHVSLPAHPFQPSPDEVQPAMWPENIDPSLSMDNLSLRDPLSLPTEFQMPDPRSAYQWMQNGGQA
ncbi:hypothetical protein GY45DRAFT_1336352 [Cubamyces sp. BRFM 1775]|nr:hypothetical protein GY45DRAFT_1336352 [Cubamyces sp. BRFM 1775]